MRRALASAIGAALGALALSLVAPHGARADDSRDARALLERSGKAVAEHEFEGSVVVAWAEGGRRQRRTVAVTSDDGVLQLGANRLLSAGDRRMIRTDEGWELLWSGGSRSSRPDPGGKYRFRVRSGARVVAGRPATLVVVREPGDRDVRARLFFDDATGLLLRRDQFDTDGRFERGFEFARLSSPRPAAVSEPGDLPKARAASSGGAPDALRDAPDGLHVPERVGDGFVLADMYSHRDGSVQLYYSDGLFGLSVFQRTGDLDWSALPKGGRPVDLHGTRARLYTTAAGAAAVWTTDDVTFTSVTDASPDELARIAADLDGGDDPGMVEEIGRFLTKPFSWG